MKTDADAGWLLGSLVKTKRLREARGWGPLRPPRSLGSLNWNPVLSGAESRKARNVFDVNVGCDRVVGVGWDGWLFYAPNRQGSSVDIDHDFVTEKLEGILKGEDLMRFIL